MAENGFEAQPRRLPSFVQKQLDNPPVLSGENARDFRTLFNEIEFSAEGGKKTAADYLVDYEATVLMWNIQRIDRVMVAVIRHMRPAAVVALVRRTSEFGDSEPGSILYREANLEALKYFRSEDAKKQFLERFEKAGYAPEASR